MVDLSVKSRREKKLNIHWGVIFAFKQWNAFIRNYPFYLPILSRVLVYISWSVALPVTRRTGIMQTRTNSLFIFSCNSAIYFLLSNTRMFCVVKFFLLINNERVIARMYATRVHIPALVGHFLSFNFTLLFLIVFSRERVRNIAEEKHSL